MLMDLNIYADACKPPTNFADGCSGVADFKFTDDCNKHDICYACGNGRGVSRQSCDESFYNNMWNTCNTKENWFLRPGCKMMAWNYYKAVRDWVGTVIKLRPSCFASRKPGFPRVCDDKKYMLCML
ncbi:hypothetical protein DPMN_136855 [Dreissena polymorpha]|uniref:Uncharacterized protein n=1 Tax=Dreissena polymorpha TaxID=45954 RepID=A0A9D4G3M1_DREPO|nr:hypothetical protein DPMN_136855 [Dreissena polymorpha]